SAGLRLTGSWRSTTLAVVRAPSQSSSGSRAVVMALSLLLPRDDVLNTTGPALRDHSIDAHSTYLPGFCGSNYTCVMLPSLRQLDYSSCRRCFLGERKEG